MIKKSKIPTILGIIILLAGTFAGVFFLNMNQIFRIGASASATPKDVRVSNISDGSVTISWVTDLATTGFLIWGESQGSINKTENEGSQSDKFLTHNISITGLKANTPYFYKINSEGATFDNNGVPWEFTTGAALNTNPNSQVISGSVIDSSGQPAKRALVYITVGGYLASSQTSDTGNFVYQLGSIRTPDLKSYAEINPTQTLLEISVSAGQEGVSSAQIFPQSANPIPPMVLGQVYDLRNLQPSVNSQAPSADLSLPQNSTQESKFNVASSSGSLSPTSVILESVKEGEIITTTEPEFFGKGPGGETITVTIHSDEVVTDSVTIPKNGSWSYVVPSNLSPGAHSITITWRDVSGITRTLTRNFVVQASELPSFEATPSGSPTASPTATPRSTPRATPTSSVSAEPVPITGDLTPTLLLSIMGIAVMAFGVFIWKTSES